MAYLLNALYVLLLLIFSPLLCWRGWKNGKYRQGWAEKFLGDAPRRTDDRPCLWFHAVSVGEVLLLKPIVAEIARKDEWDVVISTTTTTGLAVARRTYPDLVTFYAPLDFSWATRRAVARVRPTVLALVELELWPNLVSAAKDFGARVTIVNGRLSERSHRGYRRIRWALKRTLAKMDSVAAQTEEYADRFVDLGLSPAKVHVTGSVKYDGLETDRGNFQTNALRRDLGVSLFELIFVAGSTMEGEEEAALSAYLRARETHPQLRLILVPRHAERFDQVAQMLAARSISYIRRSKPATIHGKGKDSPVVLVDTLGELSAVWGLADVAFVGGSLYPGRNGQNMMEAAAYGGSILFGPHTGNFKDAVEGLLARGAARRVRDAEDLGLALLADLDDPESASERGAKGRAFVLAQRGAAARTVADLERLGRRAG
jgi:3-deoxy-D-manno-octulosonic-acid transferase